MRFISLQSLTFILCLSLMGISCNDSSTGTETSGSATFQGKVENTNNPNSANDQSVSQVEGAVVTAAYINADGSLQTMGNTQAETNAQGEYQLEVDISSAANAANRIVIRAESQGETAKAVVASEIENGASVTVEPITFESSAEAEVYQNVVANSDADVVAKADVEAIVESDVAADIEANTQNAAKLAAALASSAQAKTDFYAEQGIEVTEDKQQQIIESKQEAYIQLQNELDAASSVSAQEAAFDTFIQSVANAELDADVEAWAVAESDDFAARVLIQQSADFSSGAQAEIRKHAYYYTAAAISSAVEAEAEVLSASDATIDAIVDAGATLRSEVKSTANASEEAIDDLYVQFNEAVQAAINNDTSLNGSAFVSSNTAISGSAGLKSTLESSLNTSANLSAMLSAYSNFSTEVKSMVDSGFAQAGETEAEAYARILVLINIAA